MLDVYQTQRESSNAKLESYATLDVHQAQPESSSMPDGDQDQAEPISKLLQDFIDKKRTLHDVIKEVIEETNELTIEDFLSDLTNVLAESQDNEVQSRLLNLLAEIQKSEKVAMVDMKDQIGVSFTELVDWFNSMLTFVFF